MAWVSGQPWRVVGSLQTLNAQLRERYPRAVPPATPASAWGSIADSAHSSSSDHYPHFYAALGRTAVVCARDFPHAASLGMDAGQITEVLRLSRDPRIAYVIFAGRIFSGNGGTSPWTWRKYAGSDGHWEHFHVSVVHTAAADNTAPWQLPGGTAASTGDDVMGTWTEKITQNAGRDYLSDQQRDTVLAIAAGGAADANNKLTDLIKRLDALPTAPASGGPVGALSDNDVERIASRVADLLAARLGS